MSSLVNTDAFRGLLPSSILFRDLSLLLLVCWVGFTVAVLVVIPFSGQSSPLRSVGLACPWLPLPTVGNHDYRVWPLLLDVPSAFQCNFCHLLHLSGNTTNVPQAWLAISFIALPSNCVPSSQSLFCERPAKGHPSNCMQLLLRHLSGCYHRFCQWFWTQFLCFISVSSVTGTTFCSSASPGRWT